LLFLKHQQLQIQIYCNIIECACSLHPFSYNKQLKQEAAYLLLWTGFNWLQQWALVNMEINVWVPGEIIS